MAAVTRLGLHGGPRGLYGDFSGKAAAAVQMSGTTGFAWTPSGALDVEATLAGSTGFAFAPTGALDVEATLSGSTGFQWKPTGNLTIRGAETAAATGRGKRKRRYLVEIDKQYFEVNSIAEAQSILTQVREVATTAAENDVSSEITPKPPRVTVRTASGNKTTSQVLNRDISRTQKTINTAYRKAADLFTQRRKMDEEIGQLLRAKIHREDEDATIIALLM